MYVSIRGKKTFLNVCYFHSCLCITHAAAPLAITESLFSNATICVKIAALPRDASYLFTTYTNIWNVSKRVLAASCGIAAHNRTTHMQQRT